MSTWRRHCLARAALVLLTAAVLAGCAGPTPYQPAVDGYGYTEQAIAQDRYRVTFAGNTLTSREAVDNALMYRAAELTRELDHEHFIVLDKEIEPTTRYSGTYSGMGLHYGFHSFRHPHAFGVTMTSGWPRTRYTGYADIVIGRGEPLGDEPRAHDAREVIEHLGPVVEPAAADD